MAPIMSKGGSSVAAGMVSSAKPPKRRGRMEVDDGLAAIELVEYRREVRLARVTATRSSSGRYRPP